MTADPWDAEPVTRYPDAPTLADDADDHITRAAEVLHKAWIGRCGVTAPTRDHVAVFVRALDAAGLLVSPEHDATVAAKAWDEGYGTGVHDERMATEYNVGTAEYVSPARVNPYEREAGESDADA